MHTALARLVSASWHANLWKNPLSQLDKCDPRLFWLLSASCVPLFPPHVFSLFWPLQSLIQPVTHFYSLSTGEQLPRCAIFLFWRGTTFKREGKRKWIRRSIIKHPIWKCRTKIGRGSLWVSPPVFFLLPESLQQLLLSCVYNGMLFTQYRNYLLFPLPLIAPGMFRLGCRKLLVVVILFYFIELTLSTSCLLLSWKS